MVVPTNGLFPPIAGVITASSGAACNAGFSDSGPLPPEAILDFRLSIAPRTQSRTSSSPFPVSGVGISTGSDSSSSEMVGGWPRSESQG